MSKIGLGGTLFTVYSGLVFTALGMAFLIIQLAQGSREGLADLCTLFALVITLYGITLVLGAYWQWKEIKKGKVIRGPPEGFK